MANLQRTQTELILPSIPTESIYPVMQKEALKQYGVAGLVEVYYNNRFGEGGSPSLKSLYYAVGETKDTDGKDRTVFCNVIDDSTGKVIAVTFTPPTKEVNSMEPVGEQSSEQYGLDIGELLRFKLLTEYNSNSSQVSNKRFYGQPIAENPFEIAEIRFHPHETVNHWWTLRPDKVHRRLVYAEGIGTNPYGSEYLLQSWVRQHKFDNPDETMPRMITGTPLNEIVGYRPLRRLEQRL